MSRASSQSVGMLYSDSPVIYVRMKVQKVYLLQQSQSLGESHPVPAQAVLIYKNCKRQSGVAAYTQSFHFKQAERGCPPLLPPCSGSSPIQLHGWPRQYLPHHGTCPLHRRPAPPRSAVGIMMASVRRPHATGATCASGATASIANWSAHKAGVDHTTR